MPFFKKSVAGPGYIALNVIRVINIIVLLACVAASFVMLVKTFVISKFFFFDAVTHLVTGIISLLLIITELSLFKRYLTNNWPLLSPNSGFVTLGIVMMIIGVVILGNLNKEATSEKSMGTAAWRITIASGILACIFGLVNIFASYMFRQKSYGGYTSARRVRSKGNLAGEKGPYIPPAGSSVYSPQLSARSTVKTQHRSFFPSRRSASLPSYHPSSKYNAEQPPARNISAPINAAGGQGMTQYPGSPPVVNYSMPVAGAFPPEKPRQRASHEEEGYAPVINGVQRPDLAHHPAMQGGRF